MRKDKACGLGHSTVNLRGDLKGRFSSDEWNVNDPVYS
jgi:hypothetical protein